MPPTLETLYREQLPYVLQTVRRLGVPASAAEDVAHDIFITVKSRLPEYDPSRAVRPWLFGIAMRSAANYRDRAHLRRETTQDLDHEIDSAAGPSEHSEAASARRLVNRALTVLDDDRRTIFILHELDEVPVPEAAQVIGVPVDTAWSRLRAARKQFNEVCLSLLGAAEGGPHV